MYITISASVTASVTMIRGKEREDAEVGRCVAKVFKITPWVRRTGFSRQIDLNKGRHIVHASQGEH